MNIAIFMALFVALALGGVAFAFLGGDDAATKRRAAVGKTGGRKLSDVNADRVAKKKQIAETVAELDALRARLGDDPALWLPVFLGRAGA